MVASQQFGSLPFIEPQIEAIMDTKSTIENKEDQKRQSKPITAFEQVSATIIDESMTLIHANGTINTTYSAGRLLEHEHKWVHALDEQHNVPPTVSMTKLTTLPPQMAPLSSLSSSSSLPPSERSLSTRQVALPNIASSSSNTSGSTTHEELHEDENGEMLTSDEVILLVRKLAYGIGK
jgi:phage I-like protein